MAPSKLRTLMTWMLFGAGLVFTALSMAIDYFLLFGQWSVAAESTRLYMLGYKSLGYGAGMLFVTAALAIGGPVSRLSLKVGRDGLSADAHDDAEAGGAPTAPRTGDDHA